MRETELEQEVEDIGGDKNRERKQGRARLSAQR